MILTKITQRTSLRNKGSKGQCVLNVGAAVGESGLGCGLVLIQVFPSTVLECCQVMFDYKAKADDELELKKGDVVVLLRKVGELLLMMSRLHRL